MTLASGKLGGRFRVEEGYFPYYFTEVKGDPAYGHFAPGPSEGRI